MATSAAPASGAVARARAGASASLSRATTTTTTTTHLSPRDAARARGRVVASRVVLARADANDAPATTSENAPAPSSEPRAAKKRDDDRGDRNRGRNRKPRAKNRASSSSSSSSSRIARAADEPIVSGAAAAKFMGTIDLDDEIDAMEIFASAGALAREMSFVDAGGPISATFKGTIDDGDLSAALLSVDDDAVASFASSSRPGESAAAATATFKGTIDDGDVSNLFPAAKSKSPPPPATLGGHPELAFLCDPLAVKSIASDDATDPINSAEVVGRCNDVVRRCKSMDDVLAVVREMTAAGVAPAESTYFAVMLVCRNVAAVGPARAVEVYDAMRLNDVKVNRRTYDLAFECAIRGKRVADAMRMKEDMLAEGVPVGAKMYTSLLRALADNDVGKKKGSKHRLIRTCKVFEEMLSTGVEPPPAAFNALLLAAGRAKQPDLVARTFEEMVATGVSPSRETYETALHAVAAGGLVDVALDVFGAMRRDGFEPRKSTCNSLLEACASAPQPRVEQAFEIFYAMTGDGGLGVVPNRRTFALLIDAAVKAGEPSYAFDAFEAMRDGGVEVTLTTYNRLIHAARGSNKGGSKKAVDGLATAMKLFAEIKARDDVEPDEYTYGSLLAACASAGDYDAGETILREMTAAGVGHNRVTRHATITLLGRCDKWREALAQYRALVESGAPCEGGGREGRGVVVDADAEKISAGGDPSAPECALGYGPNRDSYSLTFDAVLSPGGAEAAIASVALEEGGGDAFIHGERAAAARAVYRDGVHAGVYDEPSASVDASSSSGGGGGGGDALRVSFTHMTRSEAIVATLVLLEGFAGMDVVDESELPSGVFIGAGPGTKGNAQRRMIAVESVLRAASLPCETIEDPRTYVIGVRRRDLAPWIAKMKGSFPVHDSASLAAGAAPVVAR